VKQTIGFAHLLPTEYRAFPCSLTYRFINILYPQIRVMLRTKLPTLLITVLCALLSACQGGFLRFDPVPTPTPLPPSAESVARDFLQAWERGDYPAMYGLLAPTTQATVSEEQFAAVYSSAVEVMTITGVTTTLRSVLEEEREAQAEFSVAFETLMAGPFEVVNTLSLQLGEGSWDVLWTRACILPQWVDGNQLYLQPEVPVRGNIYDRSGRALAVNVTQVTVGVVPGRLEDADRTLLLLSQVLGVSVASLKEEYATAPPDWFVPLGDISALDSSQYYDTLASVPGVVLREKPFRLYGDGRLAPHVVGYLGSIGAEEVEEWIAKGYSPDALVGRAGLEAWGEEFLAGRRGGRLSVVSSEGDLVAALAEKPSVPSRSVHTTLHRALQEKATELMEGKRGAIVALDPQTGQVLALVSSPTFDSNAFIPAIAAEEWQRLVSGPDQPLVNRATQGLYPPASTFKIVTMAAALGTGFYAPSSPFYCAGVWTGLGSHWPMLDWVYPNRHGALDLFTGLVVSCDVVFYQVGLALHERDPDILPSYIRGFGLGRPTGLVELNEEGGLAPDDAWKQEKLGQNWRPGDTVNMAIGQGYLLVTPLQMAVLVGAVGNGGTLYRPRVVHRVSGAQDMPEQVFTPETRGTLPIGPEHLTTIREAMRRVAGDEMGTAHYAFRDLPFSVAGKTGTAENPSGTPHAWFVGYAPADEPEIAMAVIVEHAGQGTAAAAPRFRALAEIFLGDKVPAPTEGD
jgi:penicillin-binding protein 2